MVVEIGGKNMQHISITQGKGTKLTFSNGWTISIQFGWGNYCTNRDMPVDDDRYIKFGAQEEHYISTRDYLVAATGSSAVEIAVWNERTKSPEYGGCTTWVQMENDAVAGWVPVDAIGIIIGMLVTMDSDLPNDEVSKRICKVLEEYREE
tara:strand:+ start:2081 stop:2530 length:450 start_codon:yes stop_codon:yes gene_type:complete